MRLFPLSAALAVCAALAVPLVAAAGTAAEPRTADAVRAADEAWSAAETRGDAAFVEQLLLPDYRSVQPDGRVHGKAAIVAGAAKRATDPAAAEKARAWLASHPYRGDVVITGDTAVLTAVLTTPGKDEPILSCDIFVYVDGHWKAIYSQHTSAGA